VRACVSVRFAASELLDVFMLIFVYFGMILYARHDLLKYMFALHVCNFFLIFLYLLMLYARSAFIIFIIGSGILLHVPSNYKIKPSFATHILSVVANEGFIL
jgi:hypothetical protein